MNKRALLRHLSAVTSSHDLTTDFVTSAPGDHTQGHGETIIQVHTQEILLGPEAPQGTDGATGPTRP